MLHLSRMNKINQNNDATAHSDDVANAFDDVYPYVGARLKALRVGRGMTQAQVATLIGVSPQQYQKYEDAQTKCSLTNLMVLAEYYGVPVADLLPEQTVKVAEINEADLLARLVASFSRLNHAEEKLRLVQLVEAIQQAHEPRS